MNLRLSYNIIFLAAIYLSTVDDIDAQTQKKRMPQNINIPTYSHVYPSISADGQSMILMSNYTNNGDYELKYTERDETGAWENPESIKNINKPRLDHFGSYYLSQDGQMLLFSSARAKGIGGYDLWYSEKRGKYWSVPKNFGKPVNSTGNEGNPSLSPDGKTLYFMRCESIDENDEAHCKIYSSSRKSATRWSDPVPLPKPINMSNELNPRIMIDNKTLVFASDRPGGKGKLDLYMSRHDNGTWSQPVPLTFINTPKNDEFISLTAKGDIAYYTDAYKDKFNIFIAKVPETFRPDPVILMTGKVVLEDTDAPPKGALIKAFDLNTGNLFAAPRIAETNGDFFLALPRGTIYDFSIFPNEPHYDYHVEMIQLDSLEQSEWIKPLIVLHPLKPGLIIPLPGICFDTSADSTQIKYDVAIRRLAAFMKRNPGIRIEIDVYPDSIPVDTLSVEGLSDQDTLLLQQDSSALETYFPDTTMLMADSSFADSVQVPPPPALPDPAMITGEDALIVKSALIRFGIDRDRVETKGNNLPNTEFGLQNDTYPKVIMKIID